MGVLDANYSSPASTTTMHFSHLNFKFLPPKSQPLLEQYTHLTTLAINHCHLRNLEHFPRIKSLTQVDLSHN